MANDKTGFAVFVDLENAGGKVSMLNSIIQKVKIRGDILIGKVYGYQDSYSALREVLLSNTFSAIPSIRYGANQKNNLDIQLVIDALDIAYSNQRIDSFCIVSGDSDYTPLVGKLKSMGKFVLGISRSECASNIFISACNEFVFLESVTSSVSGSSSEKKKPSRATAIRGKAQEVSEPDTKREDNAEETLNGQIAAILTEQADSDGFLYASELKNIILRLQPDFNEHIYGQPSFGKLLSMLEQKFSDISIVNDNFAVKVSLKGKESDSTAVLTKDNWIDAFSETLSLFKEEGFDRVNPSVLKAAVINKYSTFDEKHLGYKKFSDVLKILEKSKLVRIESNDSKDMLVRIM